MNRFWRAMISSVLVMVFLCASIPVFAAQSPTARTISKIVVSKKVYNGKKQSPKVTVYDDTGKKIARKYYTVKVAGKRVNAGKYKVTVTAKAP